MPRGAPPAAPPAPGSLRKRARRTRSDTRAAVRLQTSMTRSGRRRRGKLWRRFSRPAGPSRACAGRTGSCCLEPDGRPRSLYAVLQHFGGLGPIAVPLVERPFGTFGNPIFFGAYLAASLLLSAGAAHHLRVQADDAVLLACAAAQILAMWLAQSRAAFAGLLAGGFLWALKRQSGRRRVIMLSGIVLFAIGLLWQSRDRQWTHGLIWSAALKLWLAHPMLGCGLGRFHTGISGLRVGAAQSALAPAAEHRQFRAQRVLAGPR